jgi:imidazole glycerol-phosphate synthase subunit HisH
VNEVVVLDYGFGNVRSVLRAVEKNKVQAKLSSDFKEALNATGLIIPGVGAFAACMKGLGLVRAQEIIDRRLVANKPVLGICVGMQVMFESGLEHEIECEGLGQWPGIVDQLAAPILPHMGFNSIEVASGSKMFRGIEQEQFYFLHSFAAKKLEFEESSKIISPLVHYTTYFGQFIAAIENGPLWATQFHPEKSGPAGLKLINNWLEMLNEK